MSRKHRFTEEKDSKFRTILPMSMKLFKSIEKPLILGVSTSFLMLCSASAQEQPNIIWLMAEDISNDLSCYGMKAVRTPNLDWLAKDGVRFTNCFATNPICSPNRSAMMTGTHQLSINAQHHRSNRSVPLPDTVKPFTFYLRKAGYTCILGNEWVMDKGRKIDCNFLFQPIGNYDGITQFGLFDKYDSIEPGDQPFFAQIQLNVTHRGDWWEDISQKSKSRVDPDSVQLPPYMPDHPIIREDFARYLDQIEYMDNEVGMIIEDLKKKDLYNNTIIIFMGDNGRCNIFGKGYLHDPGLRIPFIMHWPKELNPAINDEVVASTDITATILDLAGVDIPCFMTGSSVLDSSFSRDYVFSTRDLWDEVLDKSRAISSKKHRYIRNDMSEIPWDANQAYLEFYRPALHIMRTLRWKGELNEKESVFLRQIKPSEELYDLENDPYELNNLADNPEYIDLLADLREKCRMEEEKLSPSSEILIPIRPWAPSVYSWIKYLHTDAYIKMLEGYEIGYEHYLQEFKSMNPN